MDHELSELEPRTRTMDENDSGHDGELLLNKCSADLGVNFAMAIQIVAWAEENISNAERGTRNAENRSPGTARLMASIIKILEYLFRHPSIISIYAVLYAFGGEVPLLDDIIGHKRPADFARDINTSREAVNKEVKAVVKYFRLKPRKGMREAAACENMTAARLKQLKRET